MTDLTQAIVRAAAVLLGLLSASAHAADVVDLAAAKKEGNVVWYTSTPIAQANKIVKVFQDKYGIKVEMFRSGGSAILRRFMQEHEAGRIAVDVLTSSDPAAMAELTKTGLFVPFRPEGFDKIPDSVKDPQGNYVAQRMNVISFFGRTDLVPPDQMPKTWRELAAEKYKSKLVMTNPSFTALQLAVVAMLSKDLGWSFYQDLEKNGILVVQGGQQAFDMVKRGERPIAAGTDSSYATAAREEGHQIQNFFPIDGTFVIDAPSAVVKGAPNPNAAKLLAEFMISTEAQQIFPESGNYAARIDVPPPAGSPALADLKIRPIDYGYVNKVSSAVKKKFSEIFQ